MFQNNPLNAFSDIWAVPPYYIDALNRLIAVFEASRRSTPQNAQKALLHD